MEVSYIKAAFEARAAIQGGRDNAAGFRADVINRLEGIYKKVSLIAWINERVQRMLLGYNCR